MKLHLYHKELLAIDGSIFRAVNSKDNIYNAEIQGRKLKGLMSISHNTLLKLTDPEARRILSKDVIHCCYNVQTAVDKDIHLIAEYEVTNHNSNQGLLKEAAQSAKESLGIETFEVVATRRMKSREDILNCVINGIIPIKGSLNSIPEDANISSFNHTLTENIISLRKSCPQDQRRYPQDKGTNVLDGTPLWDGKSVSWSTLPFKLGQRKSYSRPGA